MTSENNYWVTARKTHEEAVKVVEVLKKSFGFDSVKIEKGNLYNITLPNTVETEQNIYQKHYEFCEELNKDICNGATIVSKELFFRKFARPWD